MDTTGISWADLQWVIREIAILAGVAALVFAAGQVRQMQKSREAEVLLKILEVSFSALGANPVATFRRSFLLKPAFASYEDFQRCEDTPDAAHVGRLIWFYVFMGVVLRQKLVPEEALMRWHAPAIIRAWISLIPVIEGVRNETNSPGFGRHFEYLAVRASDWLRRNRGSEHKFFDSVQQDARNLSAEHQPFDVAVYGEGDPRR